MTGYHEDDPRTQFQTCPRCQADINRGSTRCEFCDCECDFECTSAKPEGRLTSTESEVTTDKTTRYLVLLTLNIATGLVSVLSSVLDESRGRQLSPPPAPQASAEHREKMIEFLKQQNRAHMEELNARLKQDSLSQQMHAIPVQF